MRRPVHKINSLRLSPEHACSYLPGKTARMLFLRPGANSQGIVYSHLSEHGFRRSGPYLYRPGCEHCHACIPVRVPVEDFRPARGQRRTWQRNQDVRVQLLPAKLVEEHFDLYQRYMHWRHPKGSLDKPSAADYAAFLTGNDPTFFVEFRLQSQLVGVAVVDALEDALSAVYTFYTPELPQRSLGTYAILWQIAEARRRHLRWLYLGYWIAESPKMAYKSHFRPLEQLTAAGWQTVV
ncbi:MAG TPA: arginyltransferase [Gammaproteobacteria bacterium]|nr:arginyltransferase [Gammaproteobacteria bacterium]